MAYCPKCHASISDFAKSCPSCNAEFGGESSLRPVASVVKRPRQKLSDDSSSGGFTTFLFRLVGGGIIWLGLGFFALLSAVPYGGGDKLLIGIWRLSTLIIPIWVIMGFFPRGERNDSASGDEIEQESIASNYSELNQKRDGNQPKQ